MRSTTRLLVLPVLALLLAPRVAGAQPPQPAHPEDAASIESIVAALYEVISGPAGQPRDWQRFRDLFAPGARLIPAAPRQDGSAPPSLSPDDSGQRTSDVFAQTGFVAREIARRAETFGTVAHVWSTYESRRGTNEGKPVARGINSIQVMKSAGRWWIVTVLWDQERPGNAIPAKYLSQSPQPER